MYKIYLLLVSLMATSTALIAMDFNETTVIINEAKQATEGLQDEFNNIANEEPTPLKKENIEVNSSIEPVISNVLSVTEINESIPIEMNTTIETNISSEKNNTVSVEQPIKLMLSQEINVSRSITDNNQSFCIEQDQNTSTDNNESNNSAEPDNGCLDLQGDSMQGLIIFKTRIKPYCEMSGLKFAKQYIQEDWDDIFYEKEFKMEVIKACPEIEERYKDKWTPDLYQFALEYASDSDAIPEC